jgi:hypothetical protein
MTTYINLRNVQEIHQAEREFKDKNTWKGGVVVTIEVIDKEGEAQLYFNNSFQKLDYQTILRDLKNEGIEILED